MCFNGYPEPPRDEDTWVDPDDAAADQWRGGEPEDQGDQWKRERFPDEQMSGPEYWLLRGMADAEEDDEKRNRRRRHEDTDPEQ